MSAATTRLPNVGFYRFTVQQYHRMIEDGILTENDPVELLEGVLVFKRPRNDPHIISVRCCRAAISPRVPTGYFYDSEQPITLDDSEPEPDGAVVRGSIDDPKPRAGDIALVIEVSESSLENDRNVKLRTYARAGIATYWIVNLINRQIEVYTQPDPQAEPAFYREIKTYQPGDNVPFSTDGNIVAPIAVNSLLPPGSTIAK